MLMRMKAIAEAAIGEEVRDAVITVPAVASPEPAWRSRGRTML